MTSSLSGIILNLWAKGEKKLSKNISQREAHAERVLSFLLFYLLVLTSTNANDVKVVVLESHTAKRCYLDKTCPYHRPEIASPLSSSRAIRTRTENSR